MGQHNEKRTKKDLVLYRTEIAKSDCRAAQVLLDVKEYRGANNRAYYAIYHAASAIHALDGRSYEGHKDVLANFSKDYIRTEIFPRITGRGIAAAEAIRHVSDYDDLHIATLEEAKEQLETALELIQLVEQYCDLNLQEEPGERG